MKFTVTVRSIAKYIMGPPTNRPPFWVSDKFEELPGKLIYLEGEVIDLNFAGDDADEEDKDLVLSYLEREGDIKVSSYLIEKGYLDEKAHTLKMKLNFEKDPFIRNKSANFKFIVTDGEASLPKQFIIEFGVPPPKKKEVVIVPVVLSVEDKKIVAIKEKAKKGLIDTSKYKRNFQAKASKIDGMGEFAIGFSTDAIVFGNGKLPDADVLEVSYEAADY